MGGFLEGCNGCRHLVVQVAVCHSVNPTPSISTPFFPAVWVENEAGECGEKKLGGRKKSTGGGKEVKRGSDWTWEREEKRTEGPCSKGVAEVELWGERGPGEGAQEVPCSVPPLETLPSPQDSTAKKHILCHPSVFAPWVHFCTLVY